MNELRNPTRLAIPLGDKNCPPSHRIWDDISTQSRIVRSDDIGISNFNCRWQANTLVEHHRASSVKGLSGSGLHNRHRRVSLGRNWVHFRENAYLCPGGACLPLLETWERPNLNPLTDD